jgi:hypothetical protein
MGEPGTKVMLTFLNFLIFVHVDNVRSDAALMRTAGDDFLSRLMPHLVDVYVAIAERLSAKISLQKTGMSIWGAYYCEEVIFIPSYEYLYGVIHSDKESVVKTALLKVDTPKMRNFSNEVKTQIGG